jgi:hypothetical protein
MSKNIHRCCGLLLSLGLLLAAAQVDARTGEEVLLRIHTATLLACLHVVGCCLLT